MARISDYSNLLYFALATGIFLAGVNKVWTEVEPMALDFFNETNSLEDNLGADISKSFPIQTYSTLDTGIGTYELVRE
tara:strand:+ start:2480 stop:2713 length:234 start_codon:yes stop_codon:yes gene_type:complete